MQRKVKADVAMAKQGTYGDLYARWASMEGE